jgi:hypothetical protein
MSADKMPLNKIILLNEWSLDQNFPNEKRFVDLIIHLKYTDVDSLSEFKPKERKRLIAEDHKEKFNKLIQTNSFHDYQLIGTLKRPQGIKTRILLSALDQVAYLDFVGSIFIQKIDGAKKKRKRKQPVFYCVKMTVIAQIEGIDNGLQTVEDRFVIIRAKSHEDAYDKLEKQKDEYESGYLNSDGRFVRWRIESFDDCYQTDIKSFKDLNNPEGSEVYSKFRSRRLTDDRAWKNGQ